MATTSAVLDPTQYVKINSGHNPLVLQSHRNQVRIILDDAQPGRGSINYIQLGGKDGPLSLPFVDTNVWVWAPHSKNAALIVSEFPLGSAPTVTKYSQHPFLEYAHLHTGILSTLAVATNPDGSDTTIEVEPGDGALFTENDVIQISNGIYEPSHPIIKIITGDVLTLDRRVDHGHEVGTTVEIVHTDLNVQGSLTAPVEYIIRPDSNDVIYITRLVLSMIHGSAGDMGLFGDLPPLSNGMMMRLRRNGQYLTLTNWKDNDEIKDDMFDVTFDSRASGGGSWGTSGRWTFARFGVELRLDGSTNDQLEVYVQDDLRLLDHISIKAHGHIVEI